ncbi:quinolinate synthase NadA [Candidatus Neomarinimicrobiota bacterium]
MYIDDATIAPALDLFEELERLKSEHNAVILAHYYQEPDIQDAADYLGDSLKLAQIASTVEADTIVLCGVHFMAETAKILNPAKTVLLPDLEAGCSLAESCPADRFGAFVQAHPDHTVVSYINTTAAVKGLSDIICTSSNAERVIQSIPEGKPIIFGPDRHLGKYLIEQTGRDMLLWDGSCIVHELFSEREILDLKRIYPDAQLLAHPECDDPVLRHADHIGSTTSIIKYAVEAPGRDFIIATEEGVIHQMQKLAPEKTFIPAPTSDGCSCSQCPYMRKNTLGKIIQALHDGEPEIIMDEEVRLKALVPLERMLAV